MSSNPNDIAVQNTKHQNPKTPKPQNPERQITECLIIDYNFKMKLIGFTAAVTASVASAISDVVKYVAIDKLQVNQRTLLNTWEQGLEY